MSFYCQKICGDMSFSIDEWNAANKMCNDLGIEGKERDKILHPETDPCKSQCFDCAAIVGERQLRTKALQSIQHINATPKFMSNEKNVDLLKQMAEKAYKTK